MPHGSACPTGRDLNRKDCHRLHRIVPSWKKGNDSSGGEDTGKYKDWLPKCILANRANKRLEVFYNINGKRKKHFRTATVILPISSGEDLEQHQAICRRSPSGESSFSYEIYLLIMSYISWLLENGIPPVTPVVKKKTHYGVSSFHIVKSSIRLQENMIFFRHQGSRTGWWWWLWPSRSFGTQPRKQSFSSDFTQTGILGSALTTLTIFRTVFFLENDALLCWHVQLFNVLTFSLQIAISLAQGTVPKFAVQTGKLIATSVFLKM